MAIKKLPNRDVTPRNWDELVLCLLRLLKHDSDIQSGIMFFRPVLILTLL
jgi:hypothetical protein